VQRQRTFYLFISPWLIGFFVLTLIPVVVSIYTGLTTWNGVSGFHFVGLLNYRQLFADPIFRKAVLVTLYYAVGSVGLQVLVALGLAVLLNERLPGHSIFRTLLFVPYVVTGIPIFIIWAWLYEPNYGLFNYLLGLVGIHGLNWLDSFTWAMPALIFMSVTSCGGMMLVFLAGLQTIPEELYDAAKVDGAGLFTRLRRVTIPLLRPVVGFNVIWGIIGAFQTFGQPYVMTGGGPDYLTELVGLDIYQNAFDYYRFGYASAQAVLVLLATLLLSLIVLRFSRAASA
jgi:multiple sugar transport system permease protein